MKYIVFDIDGVLADCSHRLHYIQKPIKDYDKFYSDKEILKDKVLKNGQMLFNAIDRLIEEDYRNKSGEFEKVRIAFITGRNGFGIILLILRCVFICDQLTIGDQLTKLKRH